ncbi:MAG: hypothetical protein CFE33_09395 [Pseudorhodobacter sp. PARRP1]|nr:MAG: hypothetical protein CFE33_09395 [Pseudorhodobacter sp. PARRP1]
MLKVSCVNPPHLQTAVPARTKRAVVVCMRNEAVFLLEWVAYHLNIGFDRIFIVTNNCQDGTDLMADRLAELEPVIHIRNEVSPDEAPQVVGLARALAHPAMAEMEWLLHIDADEFLNITTGAGMVGDLLQAVGPCDTVAIAWRFMASGGRQLWQGGSLLAEQTQCSAQIEEQLVFHKSLFRPDRYARVIDHMPKDPFDPDVIVRNAAGRKIPNRGQSHLTAANYRGIKDEDLTWVNADIHHYFVRSEDVFLLKNIRGDGMAKKHANHVLGSKMWTIAERATGEDRSIQRHLPSVTARLAAYDADAALHDLQKTALVWLEQQRATHLTPENRKLWDQRRKRPKKVKTP